MRFDPVAGIVLRQIYLIRGNFPRLIQMFVWVLVDITLWGFMTRYMNRVAVPGHDFVPAILGAVLLWDFLIRVMQGVSMAYMEDSWTRNLLNIFASPVSIAEYLSGLVLSSILTSTIVLIVMIALAGGAFGLSVFSYGVMAAPFLLVLFLTGIALGILATALMLRLGPAAEWLVWPIPAIISPFVGVFYPLSTLPGWMQAVSRFLPPSYVFEGIRNIAAGQAVSAGSLLCAFGLCALYILLACSLFAAVHRYAVRVGLIARYGAESF
jgi:ABC-2 type transport system permease protein